MSGYNQVVFFLANKWLNKYLKQMRNIYHKLLHAEREGSRIKQDLPLFGQKAQYLLHHHHKVLRQEFVSLSSRGRRGRDTLRAASIKLNSLNPTMWVQQNENNLFNLLHPERSSALDWLWPLLFWWGLKFSQAWQWPHELSNKSNPWLKKYIYESTPHRICSKGLQCYYLNHCYHNWKQQPMAAV